jgi:hypothetical protein
MNETRVVYLILTGKKAQGGVQSPLIFACRMCNYSEINQTESGLVYRNDLLKVSREQPGVTTDLGSDLTLVSNPSSKLGIEWFSSCLY